MHRSGWHAFIRQAPLLATGLFIGLTLLITASFYRFEKSFLSNAFQYDARNIMSLIEQKLDGLMFDVEITARYIEHNPRMDRAGFRDFVLPLYAYRKNGHHGLVWSVPVPRTGIPEVERRLEQTFGHPIKVFDLPPAGQAVTEVLPNRLFPVILAEPYVKNVGALGFNESSCPIRSKAMAAAIRTGAAVATDRLNIVGEKRKGPGFLVFRPVFFPGGGSLAARLRGFVICGFQSDDLALNFSETIGQYFDIRWYDLDSSTPTQALLDWSPTSGTRAGLKTWLFQRGQVWTGDLRSAQRHYRFIISATPRYIEMKAILYSVWVLPLGFLVSFLIGVWVREYARRLLAAEFSVQEKEAAYLKMADIFKHTSVGIVTGSLETAVLDIANAAFAEMHGYTETEIRGKPLTSFFAPGVWTNISAWVRKSVQEGKTTFEADHIRKDGSIFPVLHDIVILKGGDSKAPLWIMNGLDITERKNAEREILELWAYLKTVLNSAPNAIIATDVHGKITFLNAGAERLLGYVEDDVVGQVTPVSFFDPDELSKRLGVHLAAGVSESGTFFEQFIRNMRLGGSEKERDWWFVRKDKGRIQAQVMVAAIVNDSKSVIGYLIQAEDVSEQRRFEAERSHYQKMGAIGQLAAGIAHEINTPMQFIRDNLEFFRDNFFNLVSAFDDLGQRVNRDSSLVSRDDIRVLFERADFEYVKLEVPKALKQSLDGAQRVNDIVSSLRNMSHEDSTQFRAVNCNQIIEEALIISRNIWKKSLDIYREFDPVLPLIEAAPGELGQVLINLIVNAADAVKSLKRAEKGRLILRTHSLDAQTIELSLRDDGPGIPTAIQEKVFDPFYTTKPVGEGTGQGLYISRKIVVEKHGGKLFFTSDEHGTTFFIQLPLTQIRKAPATTSV